MKLKIILCLYLFVLISCQRQTLEEDYSNKALIPIHINWDEARLYPDNDPDENIKGASVWLFSKDNSKQQPLVYKLNNPRGETIAIPFGHYSVLIFNNTIEEFSNKVGFRGTDQFGTFEYYVKPNLLTPNVSDRLQEPDILAVWSLDDFEVTLEMIERSRTSYQGQNDLTDRLLHSLENVRPHRLVDNIYVKAHVSGLNSTVSGIGTISGVGTSVFLSTGIISDSRSSFDFSYKNVVRTNSEQTDGTVESDFNAIVPTSDVSIYTRFSLKNLYMGSRIFPTPPAGPFHHNVTKQIMDQKPSSFLTIHLRDILLPKISEASGGFGIDVADWGREEVIPLQ